MNGVQEAASSNLATPTKKSLILLEKSRIFLFSFCDIKCLKTSKNVSRNVQRNVQKSGFLRNGANNFFQAFVIFMLIVQRHFIRRMAHQGGLVAV